MNDKKVKDFMSEMEFMSEMLCDITTNIWNRFIDLRIKFLMSELEDTLVATRQLEITREIQLLQKNRQVRVNTK